MTSPKFRPLTFGVTRVSLRDGAPGVHYLRAEQPLLDYPGRMTDRLQHWAQVAPDRTFMARREKLADGGTGDWRHVSYAQAWASACSIAQALINRGLSVDRPVAILSENDLEHALLGLGCMLAGVPFVPISPAYSLVSQDFDKLRHVLRTVTPGLVFAADATRYGRAIKTAIDADIEVVLTSGQMDGRGSTSFAQLLSTPVTAQVDAAMAATGPDTIVKFLFTSGSTKLPKAVITTQRMLCANQQMLLQTFPVFGEAPPVLVDWLPWNHTFGGSHNVGIVLYNGGTLYIDDGKPTPQHFAETLRNLREISPTAYLTVPKGWEELAAALEVDAELRETFFAQIKLLFFAGAGLSQAVWDRLDAVAEAHCGERIRMMAGIGMTETSPSCTFTTGPLSMAGYVGLPAPGCEVKLVPVDGKLEGRFRGPHVMPGYWRSPEQSAAAFDEEGFYCSGDALKLADPEHPEWGLMFDGRIAEDFKLNTGVFVSVGPLRTRVIMAGAPYIQDVVVTAPNRECIGLLVFPQLAACRELAGLPDGATAEQVLASAKLRTWLGELLERLNLQATGSASRLAWACLMSEPPSLDKGEVTDKGSLNQRVILSCRAERIDALYQDADPQRVTAER